MSEPEDVAEQVLALGIDLPCLYHLFGSTLADRNLADPRHLDANVADLKQAVRFCKRAGIGVIFVLPGVVNPGQGRREALAQSAASLKRLLPIAADAGITLTVEPHVHSYLEIAGADARADREGARPEARARLRAFRLPRLSPGGDRRARAACRACASPAGEDGRAADEACQGDDQHPGGARDAEGMPASTDYVALEYTHQDYMDSLFDDILTETIQLRDVVRAWEAA